MRVALPDPPHAGKVVLEVVDLAKAFGPKVVFEDVTFEYLREIAVDLVRASREEA